MKIQGMYNGNGVKNMTDWTRQKFLILRIKNSFSLKTIRVENNTFFFNWVSLVTVYYFTVFAFLFKQERDPFQAKDREFIEFRCTLTERRCIQRWNSLRLLRNYLSSASSKRDFFIAFLLWHSHLVLLCLYYRIGRNVIFFKGRIEFTEFQLCHYREEGSQTHTELIRIRNWEGTITFLNRVSVW